MSPAGLYPSDTENILTFGDVASFNGFEGYELGSNFENYLS